MEPAKDRETQPETEDLRNMLMTFRISELQEVLCTCGRPRSGRKHELLARTLTLLRQSEGTSLRERVKNRIVELYKARFPTRSLQMTVPVNSLYSSVDVPLNNGIEPHITNGQNLISTRSSTASEPDSTSSIINRTTHEKQPPINTMIQQETHKDVYRSQFLLHDKYNSQKSHQNSNIDPLVRTQNGLPNRVIAPDQNLLLNNSNCHDGMPVHPDVRFINLPFSELQDILIKPTSLGQKRPSGYQDINLVFHFSPLQVQTITHSRSYSLQSKTEFNVQVLLRFCLAETSCVQEDSYPSRCSIKVNGKICPIPGQPPPNSQNMEPKKPHKPVNITSFCRLSPMVANQVRISWMPSDMGKRHAVTVQLVKCVTASTLIQRLKSKPLRNADHARALIKEQLAHDLDNEVATTSLKVSLCCPIGKTRMTLPCRATTCSHVQCFDGSLYIQMNERKPTWTCPVCDKKAFYDLLVVDGLFTEILQNSQDSSDIVFFQDGSWKMQSDIEQESRSAVTTIISTPSSSSSSNFKTEDKSKDKDLEIIDLTADSSDEEDSTTSVSAPLPLSSYNTPVSTHRGPRIRQVPMIPSNLPYPFSLYDTEMQTPDFYSVLPEEERMAAELYLAQTGLLNHLHEPRHSPSDVISLD